MFTKIFNTLDNFVKFAKIKDDDEDHTVDDRNDMIPNDFKYLFDDEDKKPKLDLKGKKLFPGDVSKLQQKEKDLFAAQNDAFTKKAESEHAKWVKKMKVVPEKRTKDSQVCSIGFSEVDGKWYGWSHRARAGWKVGDKVEEDTSGNPKKKEWVIKTDAEAKQMAKDFAESVS